MEERQVVIVGGGPAGGETARILAEGGIDTLILERSRSVGEPVQCAGLISPRAYEIAGRPSRVLNRIHGGRIFSPGGRSLTLRSDDEKALVIDRTEFDRGIIARARDAGASVYTGARVVEITQLFNSYRIRYVTDEGEKKCLARYLVGADGSSSVVRKEMGFPESRETLYGYGSHGQGADIGPDEVAIFLGEDIAPGFFAWIIPEGQEGGARVGLCVSSYGITDDNTPARYYEKLLSHPVASRFLSGYKAERHIAGKIDLGLLEHCVKGRCALIGDSTAMAKPISGGGIYPALIASRPLAEAIMEDTREDGPPENALDPYWEFVESGMRPEINMGMTARDVYKKLSPKNIDKAFKILNTEKVVDYIATNGNIDRPLDIAAGVFFRAPKLGFLGLSLLSSPFG